PLPGLVGAGTDNPVVHPRRHEIPQLADSRIVGAVAPAHRQRAPIDPADVSALEAAVAGDAAANRHARRAQRRLLSGGLGATLPLAHVAEDDAGVAHDRRVAGIE